MGETRVILQDDLCYFILLDLGKTNICFDWIGKSDHLIEKGIESLVYVQFDHLFFKDRPQKFVVRNLKREIG